MTAFFHACAAGSFGNHVSAFAQGEQNISPPARHADRPSHVHRVRRDRVRAYRPAPPPCAHPIHRAGSARPAWIQARRCTYHRAVKRHSHCGQPQGAIAYVPGSSLPGSPASSCLPPAPPRRRATRYAQSDCPISGIFTCRVSPWIMHSEADAFQSQPYRLGQPRDCASGDKP